MMKQLIVVILLLSSIVAAEIPSGVPQKAADALSKAKEWHPDAVLVMIEANDYAKNGNFQLKFSFFSPSDHTGLWIISTSSGSQSMQAGAVNWGTQPISGNFLDLPAAIAQARSAGMGNIVDHAMLRVGNHGLTWEITPNFNDPNFRVYLIAALSAPAAPPGKLGSPDHDKTGIYAALLKDPSSLPALSKSFSSQGGQNAPVSDVDQTAGVVGMIVVSVKSVDDPESKCLLGYRIYSDYEKAKKAFGTLSVAQMGIQTPIEHSSFEAQRGTTVNKVECESFDTPNVANDRSVRCAALHPQLPVIITGFATQFKGNGKVPESILIELQRSNAAELVLAGMSRIDQLKGH
jgi:hypothetical protein